MGPAEIHAYQVYLTQERQLAPSSLFIAACALRFLFRVTLERGCAFDEVIPAPNRLEVANVLFPVDEITVAVGCGVSQPAHQ